MQWRSSLINKKKIPLTLIRSTLSINTAMQMDLQLKSVTNMSEWMSFSSHASENSMFKY
jgi:hypothetical protein